MLPREVPCVECNAVRPHQTRPDQARKLGIIPTLNGSLLVWFGLVWIEALPSSPSPLLIVSTFSPERLLSGQLLVFPSPQIK